MNYSRIIWVVVKIMVLFLGTLNNRCRIILGTQKGTLILTTTHISPKRLKVAHSAPQFKTAQTPGRIQKVDPLIGVPINTLSSIGPQIRGSTF